MAPLYASRALAPKVLPNIPVSWLRAPHGAAHLWWTRAPFLTHLGRECNPGLAVLASSTGDATNARETPHPGQRRRSRITQLRRGASSNSLHARHDWRPPNMPRRRAPLRTSIREPVPTPRLSLWLRRRPLHPPPQAPHVARRVLACSPHRVRANSVPRSPPATANGHGSEVSVLASKRLAHGDLRTCRQEHNRLPTPGLCGQTSARARSGDTPALIPPRTKAAALPALSETPAGGPVRQPAPSVVIRSLVWPSGSPVIGPGVTRPGSERHGPGLVRADSFYAFGR